MSLSFIFDQTINKKQNLDPHGIWLLSLPAILYDGLGAQSFSVYYPNDRVAHEKETIREKVLNHIGRKMDSAKH